MTKIISIDFGYRRLGLALGDKEQKIAFPYQSIDAKKHNVLKKLTYLIQKNNCQEIVIGLPLSLEGNDTEMTKTVREFAKKVKETLKIPVKLVDERLSSYEAKTLIKQMNIPKKKIKKQIDIISAQIILKSYFKEIENQTKK